MGGRSGRGRALVKTLARAHRSQRMLQSGECASITELATAEEIDRSYLCRVLRLQLQAPGLTAQLVDPGRALG